MLLNSDVIPDDVIISINIGESQWWFGRNFRIQHQRFTISGYLATKGFGLLSAIAAKIAYPDHTVFCFTGDGGFARTMAEFVTTVK